MARTIALGVTGSIAAYKACELVRLFVKNGDDVHVVMTASATRFVTPLTFATLSKNPVSESLFPENRAWEIQHVSLAVRADALVIAPATANVIAKLAQGLADDLLSSLALATRKPIVVAPAMNDGMWANPATQANLATLRARGVTIVGPAAGDLACGTSGTGRFIGPEAVFAAVNALGVR